MNADEFIPPTLSEIAAHGGKFCAACEQWSAASDDTEGNQWERCIRCGAVGQLRFYPPALQSETPTIKASR